MEYLVNFHLYSQGINIDAYNRKLVGRIGFSGSILAYCIFELNYKIGVYWLILYFKKYVPYSLYAN
jgi:hypothetical protein